MYVFIYVFIIWERINLFPGSMTLKSHYGFFCSHFAFLLLFSFCFVDLLMYVLMYVFIYVFIIWKIINSFPGSMTIKSHYGFFFSHFAFFISEKKNYNNNLKV